MILVSFGTRPEWIKISPILDAFIANNIPHKVLFTGQHEDLIKSVQNCRTLKINSGGNRLDSIICSVLNKEQIFEDISSVLVQGDTTSSFAVALAAFHRSIKVIHLEAGLRTYDKSHPYPEEFNRRAISSLADVHFCPTELTKVQLNSENFHENVFVVGNSVLDHLTTMQSIYDKKIIITLHRRENHDKMKLWFEVIEDLAIEYPDYEFIFPMHPNPKVQEHREILKNVNVIDPLEYKEFVQLLAECQLIITDSGGIQEEASFLRKRCIICRNTTERPEALGSFSTLTTPFQLKAEFKHQLNNSIPDAECPFGDGHTSKRVVEILQELNNDERLY